ncbi:MAG: hypothetical protein JWP63_6662 [Candidatus Solibacter sp.]|nr:hypothetical protein [Candidatus Solibacter sp.]
MRNLGDNWPACVVLFAVVAASTAGMWPDLAASRVDLNDNVSHFAMIERIVDAVEHGGNPLDAWSPEWTFGFPMLRDYQTLAHLLVAAVYFALGKTVSLMTVFCWVRFLAVVLLPLSFYAAARLLDLGRPAALAAAVMAPLISSSGLFGLEYGSYVWAGNGLFPQAVAAHLFLLSLGFGWRALRRGSGFTLAGVLLGLTCLAHLIFGYMGAVSLVLAALLPDGKVPRAERVVRVLRIGAAAFALAAFQLLPLAIDSPIINHSRWEPVWKWDAFGAATTLRYLFTGQLLDANRLPVLSLAAFAGIAVVVWKRFSHAASAWVLAAAGVWIAMLFGRSFWGSVLALAGVSADMQLHRVAAGAQVFLVLLAAVAFGELWRTLAARGQTVAAIVIAMVLLAPAIRERGGYLANNEKWSRDNLAAYAGAAPALDAVIGRVKERGGRVYAGVPAGWGGQHKIGSVPFFAFLSVRQVPAVSYLYHAMALPADIQLRMNEWDPVHYRLFGIRTVVAPAGIQTALPPFWTREQTIGRFDIFAMPETGYFEVVDAPVAVHATKHSFYDVNDRWLQSDWVVKRQHLMLDLGGTSKDKPRLWPEAALPAVPALPPAGAVAAEREGEADVKIARPSYVLFKTTWHPNWHAWVDHAPVATVMLSPGFIGVPVEPGKHTVVLRYEGSAWKLWLALAGIGTIVFLARTSGSRPLTVPLPKAWLPAAGILLLALPVAIPLFTSRMALGDDALGYLPRQIEFHQNIAHGTLLPRWAPDLDRGTGQPLFLFVPPMLHYIAEVWHIAIPDLQTAINLATATLIVLFAAGMFLLGCLYFGVSGGFLCAAAALYAPYMALDLYVRAALSEFSAFPFCAFTLYGFAAFARSGRRRHLAIGTAAYAAVVLSHFMVAFYFTPLLVGFLVFMTPRAVWRPLAMGLLLGIALSAFVWLPIAVESQYVQLELSMQGGFRYTNHLLRAGQLLDSGWGYGAAKSFGLGWGHLLLATFAWTAARDRRWLKLFTASAAILCLVTLQPMGWVWEWLPVLQRIQFPWRLLGPVAICLAAVAASATPALERLGRWRWPAFAAAMALLIVPNLSHLAPSGYQDLDARLWTPAYLAQSGFETTTSGELKPRWMRTVPPFSTERLRLVSGNGEIRGLETRSLEITTAELPIAYFPGWQVTVDGAPVPIYPAEGTGLIRFELVPGNHTIAAEWKRTSPRWAGEILSLLALLALVAVLRTEAFGQKRPHRVR